MASETVNRGNILHTILMLVTITPAVVISVAAAEQTFTVAGLQTTDQISGVSVNGAWTVGATLANARVSAANTLALTFVNPMQTAATPTAGLYSIEVNRPEAPGNMPTNAA